MANLRIVFDTEVLVENGLVKRCDEGKLMRTDRTPAAISVSQNLQQTLNASLDIAFHELSVQESELFALADSFSWVGQIPAQPHRRFGYYKDQNGTMAVIDAGSDPRLLDLKVYAAKSYYDLMACYLEIRRGNLLPVPKDDWSKSQKRPRRTFKEWLRDWFEPFNWDENYS